MKVMKVLFLVRDPAVQDAVTISLDLRWPDLEIQVVQGGIEEVKMAMVLEPDIVIFHLDSFDFSLQSISELRRFSSIPIIVLSSQRTQEIMFGALTLGADRVIQLPCNVTEMATRIWALWRRVQIGRPSESDVLVRGALVVNRATHEVFLEGQKIGLTHKEFELLYLLMSKPGVVRKEIMGQLWGGEVDNVKKYIQRLRRKLGDSAVEPRWIINMHGVGYRFIGPAPSQ